MDKAHEFSTTSKKIHLKLESRPYVFGRDFNLNEEKAANTKLNSVALRKGVNKKASAA